MGATGHLLSSNCFQTRLQKTNGSLRDDRRVVPVKDHCLYVDSWTFVGWWWTVAVLHACDLAFLAAMARLYYWLLHFTTWQEGLLSYVQFQLSYKALDLLNWCFVGVAYLHGVALLWIVVLSFRARELTFNDTQTKRRKNKHNREGQHFLQVVAQLHEKLMITWVLPVFSIDGPYFDAYYLFVEYMEMLSQTYQAYHMSYSIPTKWINHVVVVLIFVNGISTPLIHWFIPAGNKKPLRRFISLMVSTLLNFINSVVIPLIIIWPYVRDFNPSIMFFPESLGFDDIWYPKAHLENQQLFVTSYVDFAATIAPHWSLLLCLWTAESMAFRREKTNVVAVVPAPANLAPIRSSAPSSKSSESIRSLARSSASNESLESSASSMNPQQGDEMCATIARMSRLLAYNLLWIMGIVVMVIHIVAQSAATITGCRLQEYPWFTTKSYCVVLNLNCHHRGIPGHSHEIDQVLSKLDEDTVFSIVLTHCPNLEVPSTIQKFNNLVGFEIYNSTLVRWGQEASLNERCHPLLNYAYVLRSNVSSFPDGLLDQLPMAIWDVEFVATNLSTLPSDLHEKWFGVDDIVFEFVPLTEIPSTLFHMQQDSMYVSLAGVPVKVIDGSIFGNNLWGLQLRNSSLVQFTKSNATEEVGMNELQRLDLRYTNVSQVPEYIRKWYWFSLNNSVDVHHSLFGSPYCDQQVNDETEREYQNRVCPETDDMTPGFFPMDLIDPQRPL